MDFQSHDTTPIASSDRAFGLVMAAFFVFVGLWPIYPGGQLRLWALAVAAIFFAAALVVPHRLAVMNRLWMRLGTVLHGLITPIALGIVFFFVVLPVGLLMRVSGNRPLALDFDQAAKSYWTPREPPGPDPQTLSDQF